MDQLLEATARAERDHFWFRGFRRFVEPLVAQALAARQGASILDCGCGTGYNLPMLRRYGRASGIDLTFSGLRYAVGRGERAVAQASATYLPFRDQQFDLVTSFDVLYGLPDAAERMALDEMRRVLRPGGHVLINVAALSALRGNHSILGGEVRRYTRALLRERLEQHGFDVRRITYTNASILPMVAGVRFIQRLGRGGHHLSEQEISIPPAPINSALSALLAVEAVALRVVNMPLGSSLLALGARQG
jgi:ubiquinone/menaquinone biosynthesis C-methylase UbiE